MQRKFLSAPRARIIAPAVGAIALVGNAAHAALPEGATTLFTSIATDFALVLAAAYTLMLTVRGGAVVFGMVKSWVSKAGK